MIQKLKGISGLWFAVVGLSVILSCNSRSGHKHENNEESQVEERVLTKPLQLNDGKKWKVNSEMKPHIQEAESQLNAFIQTGNADYKFLSIGLKAHNQKLIERCNMEGQAHEELHKWLYPHMDLITNLDSAKSVEEARQIAENLQVSFQTYHRYFE